MFNLSPTRFHTVDVLLVDDIQIHAGKSARRRILHTFNAFNEPAQADVFVISSDCLPKDSTHEERLRSVLNGD